MPDVSSIGNGHLGHLSRSQASPTTSGNGIAQQAASRGDRVEISPDAFDRLEQSTSIREDLVDSVRQAIADGTYETEERLSVAIERLIGDLS